MPNYFELERNGINLLLKIEADKSKDYASHLVQMECDFIYFFTGLLIDYEHIYEETPDQKQILTFSAEIKNNIYKNLLDNIEPKPWNNKNSQLPLQLSLWRLANLEENLISTKILLLFQIIESSNQNYPEYKVSSTTPDPLTECKLLRNIVSHQGEVNCKEIKEYFKYLNIQKEFFDPTDENYVRLLKTKLTLLRDEARKVIEASLNL